MAQRAKPTTASFFVPRKVAPKRGAPPTPPPETPTALHVQTTKPILQTKKGFPPFPRSRRKSVTQPSKSISANVLSFLPRKNSGNSTATSLPQKQKLFKMLVEKNKKAPKSKQVVETTTEELPDVSDVRSVHTSDVSRFWPYCWFTFGLMWRENL